MIPSTEKTIQVDFTDGELRLSKLNLAEYGFSKDDDLVAEIIDGVIVIGTRKVIGAKILERMRAGFAKAGVTTQDLLDQAEIERTRLFEETYGETAE